MGGRGITSWLSHRSRQQPYSRKSLVSLGKGLRGMDGRVSTWCRSCSASCSLCSHAQGAVRVLHSIVGTPKAGGAGGGGRQVYGHPANRCEGSPMQGRHPQRGGRCRHVAGSARFSKARPNQNWKLDRAGCLDIDRDSNMKHSCFFAKASACARSSKSSALTDQFR